MTYFQTHPQRRAQWGRVRRGGHTDSGVVVVHTYEAPPGRTWQAGALWLTQRGDAGSYHWLADTAGSAGHLAPWSAETWHCRHTNNWSVGISMMTYASHWSRLTTTQRTNLVRGAALGAARYSAWRVSTGRAPVPARRITRAQAMRRVPGFIGHGETDPGRRFDPGAGFPWSAFLAEYTRQLNDLTREVLSMSDIRAILAAIADVRSEVITAKSGVGRIERDLPALPEQVWGHEFPDLADPDQRDRSAGWQLQRTRRHANLALGRVGETLAAVADLDVAGVDPADLAAAIPDALAAEVVDALADRLNRKG